MASCWMLLLLLRMIHFPLTHFYLLFWELSLFSILVRLVFADPQYWLKAIPLSFTSSFYLLRQICGLNQLFLHGCSMFPELVFQNLLHLLWEFFFEKDSYFFLIYFVIWRSFAFRLFPIDCFQHFHDLNYFCHSHILGHIIYFILYRFNKVDVSYPLSFEIFSIFSLKSEKNPHYPFPWSLLCFWLHPFAS